LEQKLDRNLGKKGRDFWWGFLEQKKRISDLIWGLGFGEEEEEESCP
jgi:hypothetical protein